MKQQRFTKDFKLSILAELETGKTVAQICNKYGIKQNLIYRWKAEYKKDPSRAFMGKGHIVKLETELKRYKSLVGELYAEKNFLQEVCEKLQQSIAEQKRKGRGGCTK